MDIRDLFDQKIHKPEIISSDNFSMPASKFKIYQANDSDQVIVFESGEVIFVSNENGKSVLKLMK